MKTLFTLLICLPLVGWGQKPDSLYKTIGSSSPMSENRTITGGHSLKFADTSKLYFDYQPVVAKSDTVEVIAFCLIDSKEPRFEWKRMYAVFGWDFPAINFNGLMIYKTYLMPDRKTISPYKIPYSINSK